MFVSPENIERSEQNAESAEFERNYLLESSITTSATACFEAIRTLSLTCFELQMKPGG